MFDQHRETTTPTLKSGKPGQTKVHYCEVEDAAAWLWKFLDGARTSGELYGRALVLFAAQNYANDIVLPTSTRRSPVIPRSPKDAARKAFDRLTKDLLPQSHTDLRRAIDREAKRFSKQQQDICNAAADNVGADTP